jgi:septal ring factor EnvC (AmiA/AmiB activator)
MKKLFLMILFSTFTVVISAQELVEPTMKAPFTESRGNFLVLTNFDKIGKSEFTIEDVKNMRQELNDSKKLISEQQKLISDQRRAIDDLKKGVSSLERNVSTLERQLDDQKRKIEDLQRKVK